MFDRLTDAELDELLTHLESASSRAWEVHGLWSPMDKEMNALREYAATDMDYRDTL